VTCQQQAVDWVSPGQTYSTNHNYNYSYYSTSAVCNNNNNYYYYSPSTVGSDWSATGCRLDVTKTDLQHKQLLQLQQQQQQ